MADPGSECWVEDAHTLPQLHGTKCKSLATELCLSQVFMLTERQNVESRLIKSYLTSFMYT